jgi:hypothetical protein
VRLAPPAVVLAFLALAAPSARAEEPAKEVAPKPVPPLATTAEAKAAIAAFKAEFKGKDVAKKADAVDALGAVNHPFVVDELVKVTKHKDPELRAAAYQNLERQRAIPDVAGKAVMSGLDLKSKDVETVTHVIDTVEVLRHRGSLPVLLALCRHDDHAIVRAALDAIGDMKDVRALDAVLDLLKELKVEDGVKWDGASASVDTGTAGNGDQQAAEAQARAAAAGNARKGKSAARRMRSAGEIVYMVLKDLTGEAFASGKDARAWVEKHKADLATKKKALDDEQKQQEEAGKAAIAAAKAGK